MEDGRSYTVNNVAVASDGTVNFKLRAGEFAGVYAISETLASKAVPATISKAGDSVGTLTLSVMRGGNVTVNGTPLASNTALNEELIGSHGMLILPNRAQNSQWMPESKAKGDFVFSTDMIQSGTVGSPYYTNDEVAGLVFGNGVAEFVILFWGNGFRISAGGFDTKTMLHPTVTGLSAYFGAIPAGQEKKHNLAVKRSGTSLLVYVDGTHIFTMTSEGFKWATGISGGEQYPGNKEVCAGLYNAVFGNPNAEIAIGFRCNVNMAKPELTNQTGYFNTVLTTDASIVNSFNGKF
jgi:hypothetical protein